MKVPSLLGGIDPQLERAGWYLRDHAEERAKVKIEITACPDALFGVDDYDAELWNGVTVYCLLRQRKQTIVDMRAIRLGGEACR